MDTEPTETADETQSLIQDNDSTHDELSMPNEELTLSGMVKNLAENLRKAKKEKEIKCKRNSSTKSKIRRASVDKSSKKSQKSCDEEEEFAEEEEDDEPKPRKRIKKTDDTSEESGSAISTRVSKRKSSTSKIDESECDKNTDIDQSENKMFNLSEIELNKVVEVRYGSGKNTYHAKIVKIDQQNETMLVHYLGWNNRYDEWIHLNQIIKIFTDDYGAFKRRKLIKQESSDANSKTNKNENKNFKSISKRSSLSSISSSSSGDAKKDLDQKPDIKAIKARSSESTCSLVSSECTNVIETKNSDKKILDVDRVDEILSIKEEIVDYDQQAAEQTDTILFIETISAEIVDKCLSLIENLPQSICTKEELMPVFTSEMIVAETSQFKEKVKTEIVESMEKKLALNETNLNSVSQSGAVSEAKVHKEKENCRHGLPKFPYHLIGCSLVGKPKIKFIEEQMRLCREEYAKLKNELAAIDRKRKKLKRNMLEKSASNANADETTRHETKK